MAGPWEKYAQQAQAEDDSAPAGPWAKYQTPPPKSGPSVPETAARQFASGAAGNFDDEIIGGMDAFGRALGIKNLGSAKHLDELALANPTLDKATLLDAYRQGRDKVRSDQAADMEANPGTAITANIGGAIASPISKIGMGTKLGANATKLQRLAQLAKAGAMQGGIYAAGASNTDLTSGNMDDVTQFGKDTATGAGIGAAIPVALAGAKAAGSKGLQTLLGAKASAIEEYLPNAARINAAPDEAALKEISDKAVGDLAQKADDAKGALDQAKAAYNDHASGLKDAFKTASYDARDAVNSAQQTLKDAHNSRIQQMSGDIYDTVNKLKGDVQSGSGKALDVLDKSKANIDLNPVYQQIDNTLDKLKAEGTDEALAVADKLQDYKARTMGKNWANIPAPAAKKLIQGLDKITEYSPFAGTFDKAKNAGFKGIRAAMDDSLKQAVPEYAAAMKPVAADADLLSRVSDFGDRGTAAGLLKRLDSPTVADSRNALQELGQKYGMDFVNAAKPESLPEHKFLTQAQAKLEALRPDRVAANIDQTLASSRQKSLLDAAQAAHDSAQDALSPFKSLAPNSSGQTQAQGKLAQLAKGGNIETEAMFKKLGSLTNTDFVQAMKDRNTLAQFQKGATHGSRNTLIGSLLGAATAYGLGGGAEGALIAGSMGGSMGRVVDDWGPAITKKLLDGMIRVSKSPTMDTVRALDLPTPLKQRLATGLRNYVAEIPAASEAAMPRVAERDSNRKPTGRSQ